MKEEIMKLWKQHNISNAEFDFNCGGDSMNETELRIYSQGELVDVPELADILEAEVYNRVEFYEVSDGNYLGEWGVVRIMLSESGDSLDFCKDASSEYEEECSEDAVISLTDEEFTFLKNKISQFGIGQWAGMCQWVYSKNCVITDREEELKESLQDKLNKAIDDSMFENYEVVEGSYYAICDIPKCLDEATKQINLEIIASHCYSEAS